jgi:hypothetical protein
VSASARGACMAAAAQSAAMAVLKITFRFIVGLKDM